MGGENGVAREDSKANPDISQVSIDSERSAAMRESTEFAPILLEIVFVILPVCLQTISCANGCIFGAFTHLATTFVKSPG